MKILKFVFACGLGTVIVAAISLLLIGCAIGLVAGVLIDYWDDLHRG